MGRKLLVICGPTATGKTSLALRLAKKFSGEILSADSRQVYRLMNIGTGKDLPVNVKCQMSNVKCFGKRICFYEIDSVKIWGYDLVEPTEEFSVAQYIKIARYIIEDILRRGKLPILVGGTGLYIKAVVDGIPTAEIPKKENLRKSMGGKNIRQLFEILVQVDPVKAASLNTSDKKNPRRLIRAIEIATFNSRNRKKFTSMNQFIEADRVLYIGLTAPKKILDERIEIRVNKRVRRGIEKEIESLLHRGVTWRQQSMQALGYRQWEDYFRKFGKYSGWEKGEREGTEPRLNRGVKTQKESVINSWKTAEKQYTKRQTTWFKRDKRIKWFDISYVGWKKDVERLVGKWYISSNKELK